MADYPNPALCLVEAQARVLAGTWHVRQEAQLEAVNLHLSIRLCLLSLMASDFHKAMDADEPKWKGAIQDVYKPVFQGFPLYVKFQVWPLDSNQLFVVSFKEQS
jgi:hypothetical protein